MKKVFLILFLLLFFFACSIDTGGESSNDKYIVVALFENSFLGTGFDVEVYVNYGGTYTEYDLNNTLSGNSVSDATVTVNGTNATYDDFGSYDIDDISLNPGDTVTVSVTHSAFTISETVTVPVQPNVTLPGIGDTYGPSDPVVLEWDALSPQPDELEIRVAWTETLSEDAIWQQLTPGQTSYTIAGGILDYSGFWGPQVDINAINRTMISHELLNSSSQLRFENTTEVEITPDS